MEDRGDAGEEDWVKAAHGKAESLKAETLKAEGRSAELLDEGYLLLGKRASNF